MRSAKDGGVELTTKGQGRKWRITAVHLAAARLPHPSPCTLTRSDSEHNALAYLGAHLDPTQSMREFDRAVAKVSAWPEVHDDKAPVISAGKVFGATFLELDDSRVVVTFT